MRRRLYRLSLMRSANSFDSSARRVAPCVRVIFGLRESTLCLFHLRAITVNSDKPFILLASGLD